MGKGPFIVGVGLGLGAVGWALSAWAETPPAPGPRGLVTTAVKVRRGYRVKWRGAGAVPAGLGTTPPRFKVGDKAVIRIPPTSGAEPDKLVEGKAVVIMEVIYSERVAYGPGGVVTVLSEPGVWSYRTDLTVGGQPVEVAEPSLVKA